MTKVTIIGQVIKAEIDLEPIEFTGALTSSRSISQSVAEKPRKYQFIEFICNYGDFDVMFAHDGKRDQGVLYLGHFNDGIV